MPGAAMVDYVEIEDCKELRRLNRNLASKLRDALSYSKMRTIGTPRGPFSARVHFLHDSGDSVFWWAALPRKKRLEKNLFGHGNPGSDNCLKMDVQFNLPVVEFSRMSGGACLLHLPTGRIVLAHRGIVTIGHSRVPKTLLFAEMDATRRRPTPAMERGSSY